MNGIIIVAKCVKDTSPNRNKGKAVRDWACRPKYAGMLGNAVRGSAARRTERENVLMTVRRDILGIRESILSGDQEEALRRSDWTLDQIENSLAEGC